MERSADGSIRKVRVPKRSFSSFSSSSSSSSEGAGSTCARLRKLKRSKSLEHTYVEAMASSERKEGESAKTTEKSSSGRKVSGFLSLLHIPGEAIIDGCKRLLKIEDGTMTVRILDFGLEGTERALHRSYSSGRRTVIRAHGNETSRIVGVSASHYTLYTDLLPSVSYSHNMYYGRSHTVFAILQLSRSRKPFKGLLGPVVYDITVELQPLERPNSKHQDRSLNLPQPTISLSLVCTVRLIEERVASHE